MDTPERTQNGSSFAKFEDSPVFNFINSLSPIKPVKSTHISQTLNSLSFASIPSVFTSPHVISNKDSRCLKRHQLSDPSKAEISCKDGNKISINFEVVEAAMMSNNVASVDSLNATLKPSYSCGSPECNRTPYCTIESSSVLALEDMSTSLVSYHQGFPGTRLFEGEGDIPRICQIKQKKEGAECDWESLICDATELMIFDSTNETGNFEDLMHNSQDQRGMISCSNMPQLREEDCNDLYEAQHTFPVDPSEQYKTNNHSTLPEEALEPKDVDQPLGEFASTSMRQGTASQPSIEMDNMTVSNLHRGMRRRCLVFEMRGANRMNINRSSSYSSLMLSQSDEEVASIDKQLVPFKHNGDSSQRILPGIGLHLNTLALTPKDPKAVKHEALVTGQSYTTDSAVFRSPSTGEESLDKLLIASFERDVQPPVDDIPASEDAPQLSAEIACEDFNQSSPKKKRRRSENTGENDSCKRCNCKKSKCLKLYCECFAAGVYCIAPCSCQECHNKPIHEDTVLATRKQIETRNPLAFAPKVICSSDSIIPDIRDESNQTPASARHKRGCNCKKSSCLKKYCECYQSGVGCSINCRCESCKNAFGRKDGSSLLDVEMEPDEEENEKFEKNMVENCMQKPQIQISEAQNADSTTPATPLHLSRLQLQLPFSSKSKMQRSFTIGLSSGLQSFSTLSKPTFLRPHPKPEKNVKTNSQENELPEILRSKSTPIRGIKSGSPNSKRVSLPHCNFGSSSSPDQRCSRKLILQSIPSFPSLTHQP